MSFLYRVGLLALVASLAACSTAPVQPESATKPRSAVESRTFVKLCGKQPAATEVESLVRREITGRQIVDLRLTPLEHRQVALPSGPPLYGWSVTAQLTTRPPFGAVKQQLEERVYLVRERREGFAIIAHVEDAGERRPNWVRRDLVAIDRDIARRTRRARR